MHVFIYMLINCCCWTKIISFCVINQSRITSITLSIVHSLDANGQIWLRGNATAGEQVAEVKVINNNYPRQPVSSKVKVNLNHVNESVLKAATSLRIIGLYK